MKVYNIILTTITTLYKIMTNRRLNTFNGVFFFIYILKKNCLKFRKMSLLFSNGTKKYFQC